MGAVVGCGSGVPVNVRAFSDGTPLQKPLCFLPPDVVFPHAPLEVRGMYGTAISSCTSRAQANGMAVAFFDPSRPGACMPSVLSWTTVVEGARSRGSAACFDGGFGMAVCQASSNLAPKYRKGMTLRIFDDAGGELREAHVVSAGAPSRSASMNVENFNVLCEASFRGFPGRGERVVDVALDFQ